MKLALVFIALCAAVCIASGTKLLASSQRQLNNRETNLIKRLFKRQAYGDPHCDRRACAIPNCGKDYVAGTLPGECCERCIPWEYAQSLGIKNPHGPQAVQDPRSYQHQAQDPYHQQHQQVQTRSDVYIFGPDDGARVSTGQSIYFDCEVVSPYNPNAQPRWSRGGNQPLPHKSQSTTLPGNRKLVRLTISDATHGDAGRYECSAGSGEQASIDLQVTDGGHYPRPQPQPQSQPQPAYNPYNQYPYNQPGYNPQPQPQPYPYPQPQPQPQPQPHPQPAHGGHGAHDDDDGDDDQEHPAARPTPGAKPTAAPKPPAPEDAEAGGDEGEYPEDYTENE